MTTLSERPDCGSNSCYYVRRPAGGMRNNGRCRCHPVEIMRYIERLEAKLDSIEKACKRDALFKKFLDQGFWHAHEVDLIWRYNGEDRRHEADWLKSIFYALKHEREEAR